MNNKLTTKEQSPAYGDAQVLISQAIAQNVPVETMEKLLAMRRELKAEYAKEEYDKAMATFQSECPTIVKTKEVRTNTGATAYRYAPIESIVEQVKANLSANGFSYSTNMELLENGVKVSVKVTHKAGHSEVTDMTVPFGNKTQVMSQTQVVAAAQTFAKRYAFCNAFGILTGDEDNDAKPTDSGVKGGQTAEIKSEVSAFQKGKIQLLLAKKGKTIEELEGFILSAFNKHIETLDELSFTEAQSVIGKLVTLPDKVQETDVTELDLEEIAKKI